MLRRDFTKATLLLAGGTYARAARGLAPLKIVDVKAIPTSAGHNYQWVFLKVMTLGLRIACGARSRATTADRVCKCKCWRGLRGVPDWSYT